MKMKSMKKAISLAAASVLLMGAFTTSMAYAAPATREPVPIVAAAAEGATDKTPRQLNVHMGDDPSTQVNVTYTTAAECPSVITVKKQGDTATQSFVGESAFGQANKCFHKIVVSGLEPGTTYTYTVGEGADTYEGKFKTAPAKGSTDSFKFAYLADTQVARESDAKALGATLAEVNKIPDLDFVYLAGDITDTATSESQWELLFNNSGAFPTGGQDMFANNTIAAVRGNHDNNTLNSHINAPAEAGQVAYTFDYGPAKFIMLNLEEAKNNADARAQQEAMLREAVAEAKAAGQWTIVGFHKSLYTGASHITDSDVMAARKFWCPIFAQLDVDMVLQGHDHVYSRGFVTEDGQKADRVVNAAGETQKPANAPLYMVGGHAGGLKWYSQKNYTVSDGDPLLPNYAFLDVNSTDTGSDVKKEQVIVEMEVSQDSFTLNTYMFKYDPNTDTITTEKYLYDTLTVTRDVQVASIEGSDLGVVEKGDTVSYTVSMENLKDVNAYQAEISYDENVLELVSAQSNLENTLFSNTTDENGKAGIVIGTSDTVTNEGKTNVATFTFKLKETAPVGDTTVTLVKAQSAQKITNEDGSFDAVDVTPNMGEDTVVTEIYSYRAASDINGDGKVTLADFSIALSYYQSTTETRCDIDRDGVVDTKDYILIQSYLAA